MVLKTFCPNYRNNLILINLSNLINYQHNVTSLNSYLLIIGTLGSFIKGMTNTWLLHNLLIPFWEILQKSSWKNHASAGILGRELLESRLIFSRPGAQNWASPRSLCEYCTSHL